MMQQKTIIPYQWVGMDYLPRWEDEDSGQTIWGDRKYRIFIFGHDETNDNVCWIVDDYLPHLYVRIEEPDIINDPEMEDKMAPYFIKALDANLKQYIQKNSSKKTYLKSLLRESSIIQGYMVEEKLPMFYYKTNKHKLYKVFFRLETAMTTCYDYLNSNSIVMSNGSKVKAKAYNNGVSDRIPTVEKLIVELKLDRCGWMYAPAKQERYDGLTIDEKEYVVSWKNLRMMPEEYADKLGFPQPSSFSFDAETYSKIWTRFPKSSNLSDQLYAIGFKHRWYDSLTDKKGHVTNYILVIWDVDKKGPLNIFADKYPNVVFIYNKTEIELLRNIFELIIRLNPTLMISFNGLGFDWDYIEERCNIFGVKVPNMSRIRSWYKTQFRRKNWKYFKSCWPQYLGRIDVDMLYLAKVQMFKFNNYKLKTLAAGILGHTKVDLPYKEQFRLYAEGRPEGMNLIIDYLLTDILLPEQLYDKLDTTMYLHENGSVMHVNPFDLYTDGQSIRCICQLYSDVVNDGMYVNSRTIWKAGKYVGGLVFDQIPGIYTNVLTFDFSSLYPSVMKAKNICYTTLIEDVDAELYSDEECHIAEGKVPVVDKKTKEVIEEPYYKFRYIHKSTRVGLLPKIVTRLNALRTKYKGFMKKAGIELKKWQKKLEEYGNDVLMDDPEYVNVLDNIDKWSKEHAKWNVKQQATKVSANSMYGFMGMKSGKFSFIEGGMSTTIEGRKAISKALKIIITEFGAVLVYGDTDSVMVKFPEGFITEDNYKEKVEYIGKFISDQFPDEINIVFENYFKTFLTVTKKRYCGLKLHPLIKNRLPTIDEIFKYDLMYIKGLISIRGNSCGIVYENFDYFLAMMMIKRPFDELLDYIHQMGIKICRRDYPLSDYTFSQRLGKDYKNQSSEMAVFSDCLRQVGRIHKAGEELEYVYVRTNGPCLKGYKMQAPDLFIENDNILDTIYYITNKIAKPLEQLLMCVYDDSNLKNYEKKIIRPRKPTAVQKVTDKWHLQLYIQKYVAGIHENWQDVQSHIKYLRQIAETTEIKVLTN